MQIGTFLPRELLPSNHQMLLESHVEIVLTGVKVQVENRHMKLTRFGKRAEPYLALDMSSNGDHDSFTFFLHV
jgi:hypothetical protein